MPAPRYLKVYNDLKKKVMTGKFGDGDLLPSENQLCSRYGITRLTVRQALNMLVQEGYISKKHGKGSIVTQHRNSLGLLSFKGFSDVVEKTNIAIATMELAPAKKQQWDKNFFFPLSNDEKKAGCIFLHRLRMAGNDPVMVEYTYLPDTKIPGFIQQPLLNNSLFTTLRKRYSIDIISVEQELKAIMPGEKLAKQLQIKTSVPIIHIYRKYHTDIDRFFIYSSLFCTTEKYTLNNTFNHLPIK